MTLCIYHTNTTFNDPKEEGFEKQCGKRGKCWFPAFSPFPTMFSTLPKSNFIFSFTFMFSANPFNLDKILSFGKRFKFLLIDHGSFGYVLLENWCRYM